MAYHEILFYTMLLIVAFLYSSVGHGGASGYLALMAFFSFAPGTMRYTALLLNLVVSIVAYLQYYRKGHFDWKLFWPFVVTSIPMSYVGGLISIDGGVYKKILAVLLLFSVLRLLDIGFKDRDTHIEQNKGLAMFIGAIIGFMSGLIGIGGGILLSPIILLLHWAGMKKTAAVSALFIFVNSLAGLAGVAKNGMVFNQGMAWMIGIAFTGGIVGSWLGSTTFDNRLLKRILALVLVIASVKLMTT